MLVYIRDIMDVSDIANLETGTNRRAEFYAYCKNKNDSV